jgi:hypothetical protein
VRGAGGARAGSRRSSWACVQARPLLRKDRVLSGLILRKRWLWSRDPGAGDVGWPTMRW